MLLDVLSLLFGGLVLYLGAEWLVKGSAGLAHSLGVKPLVIGLTVVAYGTSAPELAVSTAAILDDASPIVLGNIIGSCIANIALILGVSALIAPPAVDGQLIRRELPVMCAATLAVPLTLLDGQVSFVEAAILLACAVAFTLYTLFVAAPSSPESVDVELPDGVTDTPPEEQAKLRLSGITVVGLALLIGGGELFVGGAQGLAHALGMSERVVGLTVVAIGTSLPELAASLVAATRGYSSLAVGNVVGSNIFNVFLILGVVGLIRPIQGDLSIMATDIAFLVGTTVIGVLFMRGSRNISRLEGAILIAVYLAFTGLAVATAGS
ncbi:calcium/sodium antiporter [Haliangium ochraceum]|uniref:Na+/Ca+ antiporter, CaCA family n=1 Tax=Haliangium ochraceum (strain DSM 14365 / JCM 11303 / SMP-2) TaxID=502025 RepID=D0LJW1_HALO1|nr:calcium/sodium antiporter [Haliangium ochraceum]ACY18468.1 Na+/Ca+ antiporter, CaCA family [Haliangium ochraceum DSM 14365]